MIYDNCVKLNACLDCTDEAIDCTGCEDYVIPLFKTDNPIIHL